MSQQTCISVSDFNITTLVCISAVKSVSDMDLKQDAVERLFEHFVANKMFLTNLALQNTLKGKIVEFSSVMPFVAKYERILFPEEFMDLDE
jgi:hypothetical protein